MSLARPWLHIPLSSSAPCHAPGFGLLSPSQRAPSSPCRLGAREKGHPSGRKPWSFLFSSSGENKVIFGPFQYKSDFFFFLSFSKPCVWQASGRGVEIRACILNTFAFLLGVGFVCLPLPGCLPCLWIVDFAQRLLLSQRK